MKKRKVIVFEGEQLNKQDSGVIQDIQQSLKKIDEFPIYTPDLQWFEQMIEEEKKQVRITFKKELIFFLIIASIILGGIITALNHIPKVFIILQILTTLFIIMYTTVQFIKKVRIHER